MMYEALVYFDGPLSRWARQPDRMREVMWSYRTRFLPIAIGKAKGRARGLKHVHWLILDEEGCVIAGQLPTVGMGDIGGTHYAPPATGATQKVVTPVEIVTEDGAVLNVPTVSPAERQEMSDEIVKRIISLRRRGSL